LKFDIDDILEKFIDHEINSFNYLIHLDSLKSIFHFGILSRNKIEQVGFYTKDISKDIYLENRKRAFNKFFPNEDIFDHVPLYISSHTPMIHSIYNNIAKVYYTILKIDIFLFYSLTEEEISKVKISNSSVKRENLDDSFKISILFDILDELNNFLNLEF